VVVAQLLSVVGRKDYDGVLKLAGALQGVKNSPEIVVTFAARKRKSLLMSFLHVCPEPVMVKPSSYI
jgi:hypothetical protein